MVRILRLFYAHFIGNITFEAIVILKPSAKSACGLGLFNAKTIYMGEDILKSPNCYSSLEQVYNIDTKNIQFRPIG
jgi:hypothetical protein